MTKKRGFFISLIILLVLITVFLFTVEHENSHNTTIPDSVLFQEAPILAPEQALNTFQLEDGFEIEVVASEPLIHDPVAMDFDARGRIYVVEMRGFMSGVDDEGDDDPTGKIVILEDHDNDGVMDTSKVFLDGLVLPRAVAVVNKGILYAEPPNLWFVENINDKPGKRILVDSAYATSGNVEHMPNGLLRGIDNWYYNAKSNDRYRYIDGDWVKEKTEFRGQWGITKDNFGRLIYNTNSSQLRGDYLPPNTLIRNPNITKWNGINVDLVGDQRVYPIRPTPGVNRGYRDHVLNDQLRLVDFTAASGPLIYRGDQFPEEYVGNAFVCEPAGNLIKRNILSVDGVKVKARQAYEDKEFLASKDERFRPVSLYNAPDGTLYVIDMYRGIIQDRYYITDYLWEEAKSRNLVEPLGLGRIYRVEYAKKTLLEKWWDKVTGRKEVALNEASAEELVDYLSHENGWWRDMAQQLLVERQNKDVVPRLKNLLQDDNPVSVVHALWTLEGLNSTKPENIEAAFQADHPEILAAAIRIAADNAGTPYANEALQLYNSVITITEPLVQMQLAISLGEFISEGSEKAMQMLNSIAVEHGNDFLMKEAIASSVYNKEGMLSSMLPESSSQLSDYLQEVAANNPDLNKRLNLSKDEIGQFVSGKILYSKFCAGCHGKNGEGIVPIAPPLNRSEWVTGPAERLTKIILHGLQGPVTVNGEVYKAPDIQPVMPGLKDNHEISNEEIAAIETFIRNAWNNEADAVNSTTVSNIRDKTSKRVEPYTEAELK